MNIATTRGDSGQTSLIGGIRVSKSNLRIEAGGAIDELNSAMGFARSICKNTEVHDLVKAIQHELFIIGSSLATPADSKKPPPKINIDMIDILTEHVHHIETTSSISFEWSIPGDNPVSAAFDIARTVCRRAECLIVRLTEFEEQIDPNIIPYVNRLSDLLWLLGRLLETSADSNTEHV